jgi:hypothetical protein
MKVFCPLSGKGTEDEGEFEGDYDFGKRNLGTSQPGMNASSPAQTELPNQNRPPRRRPVRCAQAGLL